MSENNTKPEVEVDNDKIELDEDVRAGLGCIIIAIVAILFVALLAFAIKSPGLLLLIVLGAAVLIYWRIAKLNRMKSGK